MGDSSYSMLSPNCSVVEKFTLTGTADTFRFENGRNVTVTVESEDLKRERDSAHVHTKILSEFKGDSHKPRLLTYHAGLIGCHMSVETGDAIRIFNRENKSRHLVKGIAPPKDLQFAVHAPLLAAVDEQCNLVVYRVSSFCEAEKVIELTGWNPPEEGDPRVSWCPYYPESPDDPDDCVHMLTLFKGKTVAVINVSNISEEHGSEAVEFHVAAESKESIFTIQMEHRVTAANISPDSTALAVGTDAGLVSFYVINENEMKFAHNWDPRLKTAISHLHFLDSLERKEDARFWKHCVAAGDGGRRLALYECVAWKCLGSIRFESELETAGFSVTVDPQLRYIHILDVDGMNLFLIELDFSSGSPKFSSLTQITFCRPLHYILPYEVKDEEENEEMFPNDDESSESRENVEVRYIALGARSMVELEVHVERMAAATAEEKEEESEEKEDIPTVKLQLPSTSQLPQDEASSSYQTTGMDREEMEQKLNDLSQKLDSLAFQMERAECERKASTTNENLLLVLQQFKEEFSLREDRLMANVSDLIETSRTETLQAVKGALTESQRSMEVLVQTGQKHSIESINSRVGEKMREAMTAVVVPQLDRICTQLFKQLNDTFRSGLEQYLTQFRALHTATLAAVASATPAPSVVPSDRSALLQMIKTHQVPLAFETVLNQEDQTALEYVCKNVDPDDFLSKYRLPQNTILMLISQLAFRLDSETELRFRYLSPLLEQLRTDDQTTLLTAQPILTDLIRHLHEFAAATANSSQKALARMMSQIASMKLNQIVSFKTPLHM